jgi:lipooligosaccharide transport system ATP-binding protein
MDPFFCRHTLAGMKTVTYHPNLVDRPFFFMIHCCRRSMDRYKILLSAENLVKRYDDLTAVAGISFSIESGECYGILGPNGAGKSTTIRMIYGFTPITGGRISLFGMDVAGELAAIKYRIGVCQQESNLDPDLTLLQNMEVYASYFDIPKAEARKRINSLLEFTALEHRRDSAVDSLSGGMKRRLVIARALINNPDLLILDEPTTGLDPQSRHQIWDRLNELKASGLTILITTHYMDEAARLCDRLIIMDHGKILEEGRPAALVERHAGRNVIEIDEPPEELRAFVRSRSLAHDDMGHRLIIYIHDGEELFNRVRDEFCSGNCLLRMATLEDVFLKLTGRDLRE